MTECFCPQCTPDPAPTYTEAHRHACEVRHVADLPSDAERSRYLVLVREARGEATSTNLRTAAWMEMKRRAGKTIKPTETLLLP